MKTNMPDNLILSDKLADIFAKAPSVQFASGIEDLESLACGSSDNSEWTVSYTLPDGRKMDEVNVVRVKNGISANYTEAYMRRRDPNCMVVADENPSDKPKFHDRFGHSFEQTRQETFDWLSEQDLAVFAFEMGSSGLGGDALAVCPANACFFAFGLGLLQGVLDVRKLNRSFKPSFIIYVAPPFRHTHFEGRQVVVHNRVEEHEMFSYNLYPGPSAKKGVYGALINMGVRENWVTAHCSAVEVVTPYDNIVTFMHEGASGGGKSEMLQQPHRLPDGQIQIGRNIITDEQKFLEIRRTCDLHPVCDDMAMCHSSFQKDDGKLRVMDAEDGWFVRVNHITNYGTDHDLEHLTVHPPKSLLFLNIDVVSGGTALIWEHLEDEPGVPCPNPRVVLPRRIVPDSVEGNVAVDIRSFGVRTPPCTKDKPTYGIIGLFHILPPALAWLWRLVAPRGYSNPSIVDEGAMSSEGVGSYWPFTTGRKVDQANLLLQQFVDSTRTRYILTPNQHIGAWETGFMPQWLARDYLARRGHAQFRPGQLKSSRLPLLGYALNNIRIEGINVPRELLQVEKQPEVGTEGYDNGSEILQNFFESELKKYMHQDLNPLGREIINCCLDKGSLEDYQKLIKTASQ
ncbi:hypothetical protein L21SP3_01723 [Sedimentisphaera cyanobacteriorum]|uniref:DUF4914 domain-containing protein n=1 Tax=Sedimentisphaera cyanobacteriorum TaxID=1940790 RepID=A0A1Q2HR56_9BACT|nr:DUF4914 family protein [Sedimentisphaera cyanobacteriorum]AQQ09902.1 hypothetical protein L21SP3_01723 [Sedimentisphaera cyanobacteriorum]